jgi:hypothetical protein
MQYRCIKNFNWLKATQQETNIHVTHLSRQRVHAVLRNHEQLQNFDVVRKIETAIKFAKAM